ncbi:MAG: hypothetical protein ACOYVJ_04940 [Nitrospirota bacterium]
MVPEENTGELSQEPAPVAWAAFLEAYPSGTLCPVKGLIELDGPFFNITTPDVRLYCENPTCRGEQTFGYSGLKLSISIGKKDEYLLHYTCRHCKTSRKTLFVHIDITSLFGTNRALKYGESSLL